MQRKRPLVLMILDGWGYREDRLSHNAIASAKTPQWDKWWQNNPHILLSASGSDVGLPTGQMGNSEVGHMHIGAGRILNQDLTRINDAIAHGELTDNQTLTELIKDLRESNKALHVMGLLSAGGVHSHESHLFALMKLCHTHNFNNIYLHLFLDGRDTPPQSAFSSLGKLSACLSQYPGAKIASLCGRYFAMDRDRRWDRTAAVYRLLTEGNAEHRYADAENALNCFYSKGLFDEFIPPTQIAPGKVIEDGDAIFFFNFRADRARQLTEAFINPDFSAFPRKHQPHLSHFVSMTQYARHLKTEVVFPQLLPRKTLGEVLAENGLTQLRLAETEKYAHVTFFFNGGNEQVFNNEDRILIPSPSVATYDLQPEMSAPELTRALVDAIESDAYDVIICNYANADMVGHSGNFAATVSAIEALDNCFVEINAALQQKNAALLITADHGNAEAMFDEKTGQAHTAHTSEPVPLLYVGGGWHFNENCSGSLIDIAPTILNLLDLPKPREMTGKNLLVADYE